MHNFIIKPIRFNYFPMMILIMKKLNKVHQWCFKF